MLGYVAIRKPSFLLIDEPELNLHPSLQIDFLTSLASYATFGVMFASHSIGLARATADRIYSFQKSGYISCARPFEQTPNLTEFVGELSFSSFKEMGCETILLVEGVTDVKAVQQFLRVLRKDHTTVIIPLGGSQLIKPGVQMELRELGRLSNSVAVLIDSERDVADAPLSQDRDGFVRDCHALGFAVHVPKFRSFENYLSDAAIKTVKGEKYRALGPYEKLQDLDPSWGKEENWRIARAMNESEIKTTDVGIFLAGLK